MMAGFTAYQPTHVVLQALKKVGGELTKTWIEVYYAAEQGEAGGLTEIFSFDE